MLVEDQELFKLTDQVQDIIREALEEEETAELIMELLVALEEQTLVEVVEEIEIELLQPEDLVL